MIIFKKLRNWLFKPKPYLLDDKYKVVPAFEFKGEVYYTHEDPINTLTGRGLSFLKINEEILMRCSTDYLIAHTEACDAIFSNPKKIDLPHLIKLNQNLKERVKLLMALPDHVYKAAAIVYWTKDESPYRYDRVAGERKIAAFKQSPEMYDFFLQGRLDRLIPSLIMPEEGSARYLEMIEAINDMHLKDLQKILSHSTMMQDIKS